MEGFISLSVLRGRAAKAVKAPRGWENQGLSSCSLCLRTPLPTKKGAVSVISLDFQKLFNRLDHAHILRSYGRLGASTEIIRLLASFLSMKVMRVKVDDQLSSPRAVNGVAPQGSCAGVQMYLSLIHI